jgi:hypothetical protein
MFRATLCLLLATATLVLAACGSQAGAGGSDPAAAVPRGALLYLGATLRPQGDARDGALAAAGKILRTSDPAARIRSLAGDALSAGGPRVNFSRDVDPWLGDHGALWLDAPPRAGADPPGAVALEVRDEDQARTKIDQLSRRAGEPLHSQGDLEVTRKGDAVAFKDGWVYLGDEAAVKRAVASDSHLSDANAYKQAVADLPGGRLATYFLDTSRFFDAILAGDPQAAQRLGPARAFFEQDARPLAGGFTADRDRLSVESVGHPGQPGSLTALGGGAAPSLVRELPGDSWAAAGVAKLGQTLRTTFGRLAGAFGGAAAQNELRREYGIDLERDVFSWMGDAAIFVRGTTPRSVDGGLVIQVTDNARAAQAFGTFVGLARARGGLDTQPVRLPGADAAFDLGARDAPKPLILARGHDRMVLAYGRAAAAAALAPSSRLGDAPTYSDARNALDGYDPALLVSMPAIVSLVESSGNADADFARAKPYLDAFGVIASGSRREGDEVRSRLAAGLRP